MGTDAKKPTSKKNKRETTALVEELKEQSCELSS